ncbi:hypothetical protein J4210_05160 [Candidatus Woesearchaeota archaeon]|nr:hypothetical protein [Candidatus Woesearchaeota archaeon]
MRFLNDHTIKLERELNDLDRFVLKFLKVLEKYVDYVIISGYIAILFGRSRATEDVDVFIKPIDREQFIRLYHHLQKDGFWCLNAESDDEVYSYLGEGIAIRFARSGEAIPNFEVKIAKNILSLATFSDAIEVETSEGTIKISSLERQVAFKKYYLGSDKDLEDAKHIEELFKDHLDYDTIKKYKDLIKKEYG